MKRETKTLQAFPLLETQCLVTFTRGKIIEITASYFVLITAFAAFALIWQSAVAIECKQAFGFSTAQNCFWGIPAPTSLFWGHSDEASALRKLFALKEVWSGSVVLNINSLGEKIGGRRAETRAIFRSQHSFSWRVSTVVISDSLAPVLDVKICF